MFLFEILSPISGFFDIVLSELYNFTQNFGLAIILLTLMIKLVTFPLNNKQIESAKKMQAIQPEMKKLQEKYKHDKQKQNQAVMEFMQKNKVNPMAGCLPLLVQMPILISLFHLLRTAAFDDRFQIAQMEGFEPYLFRSFEFLNLLELNPWEQITQGGISGLEFAILPILAGITTFYYQKLSMTDPSQKMLFYMMPAMLLFISFTLPAGVVLYWNVNNIFSVGQHFLLKGRKQEKFEVIAPDVDAGETGKASTKKEKSPIPANNKPASANSPGNPSSPKGESAVASTNHPAPKKKKPSKKKRKKKKGA